MWINLGQRNKLLAEGLEGMRRGLEHWRKQNNFSLGGLLTLALGRAEAQASDLGAAIATLDTALATSERVGYRVFDAELHRVRGEILLMHNPTPRAAAEDAFQAAISIASQQSARSFSPARGALARQTSPIRWPSGRHSPDPSPRARRLAVILGNAGNRGGAKSARTLGRCWVAGERFSSRAY